MSKIQLTLRLAGLLLSLILFVNLASPLSNPLPVLAGGQIGGKLAKGGSKAAPSAVLVKPTVSDKAKKALNILRSSKDVEKTVLNPDQVNALVLFRRNLSKDEQKLFERWLTSKSIATNYSPTQYKELRRYTLGQIGESGLEDVLKKASKELPEFAKLKAVYGTNHNVTAHGIDSIFLQATKGRYNVVEAKTISDPFRKVDINILGTTKSKGTQMSDRWVKKSLEQELRNAPDSVRKEFEALAAARAKDYSRTLVLTYPRGIKNTTTKTGALTAMSEMVNSSLINSDKITHIIVRDLKTGAIKVVKKP